MASLPPAPAPSPARLPPAGPARPVSFSLFYFAAGEEAASDGYRLLLESARFADRNGFEAVWTPERHFHAFGGAYPNPSVTGAALAAVTENVGIRAGSVVLPLHSPVRVAEEWAVVDNLSRGRVAISFAAGWQPNDFVLNPSAYANAKEDLPRDIDTVRRLWRGETVAMPGHDGEPVDVRTLPRPVQPELPVWLTSAGTPATFERAGDARRQRAHAPARPVDRAARREHRALPRRVGRRRSRGRGSRHADAAHLPRPTTPTPRARSAREPMKGYLGTAVGLLRDVASAFPTFAEPRRRAPTTCSSRSPTTSSISCSRSRRSATSARAGCSARPTTSPRSSRRCPPSGVDEVACLIDFGIDTDEVLDVARPAARGQAARRRAACRRSRCRRRGGNRSRRDRVDWTTRRQRRRARRAPRRHAPAVHAVARRDARGRSGRPRRARRRSATSWSAARRCPTALAAELRDAAAGPVHEHVRADRDDDLVADPRDRPTRSRPRSRSGCPIANTTIFVLDPDGQPAAARHLRRAAHRRRGRGPRLPRPARAHGRALRRSAGHGTGVRHRRRRADPRRRARSSSPGEPTTR